MVLVMGLLSAGLSAQVANRGNSQADVSTWHSAWASAHNVGRMIPGLAGGTVRLVIRPALPGRSLRVQLSNVRGNTSAVFSAAFVAVAGADGAVAPGTSRPLAFGGARMLTLEPGAMMWSDPVPFDVVAFQRLAVSLDIVSASDVSMDTLALVTTYQAKGHHAAESSGAAFSPISPKAPGSTVDEYPMYWISALDVLSTAVARTIVGVGDSWIDGRCSTTEARMVRPDRYQRWLDVLAARFAAAHSGTPTGIINAGIAGNRIIPGGGNGPALLERLDRDVLERAGVTHVLFQQGMNDIGNGASAEQVTAAIGQVISRVHAKGISIVGATLIPVARPDRIRWTAPFDETRRAVNDWMRTRAGFDAIIDFDRLMSGGAVYEGAQSLKPEFACDDNLHPNADAYRAMAEFVDLTLFDDPR